MADALMENWSETKTALTDGLSGTKKSVMETTLENTKKYLAEAASTGATQAGNVATLNKVILPVIRRVMPTVIANEIVGIRLACEISVINRSRRLTSCKITFINFCCCA